jgi:murein DD-endopeptidase MepM/ murein hydrolase activator NlpD
MQEPIFDITHYNPRNKTIRARLHPSARAATKPWQWPLPRLGNRTPIVLAEHESLNRRGVDLGYVVAPFDSELFVPVYAAQSGEVALATEGSDGFAISIDHGAWTTHYAHLSKMFVTRTLPRLRRRELVSAGDVIGYAERAPLHVRFELWERAFTGGFECVDPVPHLEKWTITCPASQLTRQLSSDGGEAA